MDQTMSTVLMVVLMIGLMYFLMIRPENKRKKQAQEMRDSLKKGDVITTIGGIVGRIVYIGAETLVIETSEDRVRLEIAKWAVSTTGVQTGEQAEPAKKEKKAEETSEESAPAELPAEEDPSEKAE